MTHPLLALEQLRARTAPTYTERAILARLDAIRAVVAEQAADEGLWFYAATVSEDYLQQALRRLHAVIEER